MRILVADDHELFLKGLEFILRDKSQADMNDNGTGEKNRKGARMLGRYG